MNRAEDTERDQEWRETVRASFGALEALASAARAPSDDELAHLELLARFFEQTACRLRWEGVVEKGARAAALRLLLRELALWNGSSPAPSAIVYTARTVLLMLDPKWDRLWQRGPLRTARPSRRIPSPRR